MGKDSHNTSSEEPTSSITSATVTGESTQTTATTAPVSSTCQTIDSRAATDAQIATATTAAAGATPAAAQATRENDVGNRTTSAAARAEDGIDRTAVIFPSDPMNVQGIIDLLRAYAGNYTHFQVASVGFTGYFILPGLDQETLYRLQASKDTSLAMYLADWEKESIRRHREAGGRVMARLSFGGFDAGPIDTEDTDTTPDVPSKEGSC